MPNEIIIGSVLDDSTWETIPDGSVQCVVTSPPYYGLRDYGVEGQLGLEATPEEYIARMVEVFRQVRRVLRDDGTIWINMGDSYASGKGTCHNPGGGDKSYIQEKQRYPLDRGNKSTLTASGLKPKDLLGIPWLLAFALRADGWYLRQDIIWHKPNPMPESVTDRCTKAHEYIFLLTKKPRYFYDAEAVKEKAEYGRREWSDTQGNMAGVGIGGVRGHATVSGGDPSTGRNKRSVWTVPTHSFPSAHFATFPPKLIEPCIKAGTSEKGCCPECGSPWERVVEKTKLTRERPNDYVKRTGEPGTGNSCANSVAGVSCKTVAWRPTCECGGNYMGGKHGEYTPGPCVVLDPFMGSGTTGMVASLLGRDWLGIELNETYAQMAKDRIGSAVAPETYTKAACPEEAPLFNA